MLKFFRKIRQKLLKRNKVKQYIAYALGEILLVVVGILIALQVDNWNTGQKASKEELKLLREMRLNLANDLEDCYWNIKKQKELSISNTAVLYHLEERSPFHDSLKTHYGNLVYSTTQRRNMAAYDHLKTKGIDLIQNDNLRRNITALYSERYYYIERQELEYDNKYQMNEMIPKLNAKVLLNEETKTGKPINLKLLQEDEEFKGTLRMNVKIRQFMLNRYTSLADDLNSLIEHIDIELGKREG